MTGGIGDTIIGIPFLSILKKSEPRLDINVLVDPLNKDILEGRPEISEFIIYPRSRNVFPLARLIRTLRQRRFVAIVGLIPSNLKSHSLMARLGGSCRSIKHLHRYPAESQDWQFWFTDLVRDDGRHMVLANLDLLRPLGIDVSGIPQEDVRQRMRILLTPHELTWLEEQYPKSSARAVRIGFHPGCKQGWEFKQWDRRKYAELADRIVQEQGAEVIWFGGKEETDIVESIKTGMRNDSTTVAGKLPLRRTAALIGTCDLFISNDSGLMHVATAMDVTTIGLYSSTNPRNNPARTGPFGSRHRVVQAVEIQQIGVEDVYAEVVRCLERGGGKP